MQELPRNVKYIHAYTEEAIDVESTACEAMQKLSSLEFERVLHPAFEEDELKLILVGAMLGLMVGLFQFTVMVGG